MVEFYFCAFHLLPCCCHACQFCMYFEFYNILLSSCAVSIHLCLPFIAFHFFLCFHIVVWNHFPSAKGFFPWLVQLEVYMFYWYFLFFFSFIFISWQLITLQYRSGPCHTLTWISHGFTCIPHPDPPSHLPLYPIPLGLPIAPGPSTCLMHPTWAGDLFHCR